MGDAVPVQSTALAGAAAFRNGMTAFYNEHNPFAAAWLRKLIERNLIAPGVVDERDIQDIKPDELSGYTQCHFFAGIGGWVAN